MGYTRSKASVERMLVYLRQMAKARPDGEHLYWKTDNPTRLAHNLRQALHACRYWAEFKPYARLRPFIQFLVKEHDTVVGQWIDVDMMELAFEDNGEIVQEIKVDYEVTLQDILGEIMNQPKTLEQAFFPLMSNQAIDELPMLFKWAEDQGWSIINHEEAGITLTKRPVDAELKWRPE